MVACIKQWNSLGAQKIALHLGFYCGSLHYYLELWHFVCDHTRALMFSVKKASLLHFTDLTVNPLNGYWLFALYWTVAWDSSMPIQCTALCRTKCVDLWSGFLQSSPCCPSDSGFPLHLEKMSIENPAQPLDLMPIKHNQLLQLLDTGEIILYGAPWWFVSMLVQGWEVLLQWHLCYVSLQCCRLLQNLTGRWAL